MKKKSALKQSPLLPIAMLAIAVALLVYQYRAPTTLFLWQEYRVLPELALSTGQSASLAFEMGNYYFNWGGGSPHAYDLDRAQKFYQYAYKSDPGLSALGLQLGRTHFLEAEFAEAVVLFSSYINEKEGTDDPYIENAYYLRGLTYAYANMFPRAEEDFKKLLDWEDPGGKWATYIDLSWVYLRWGKFEEAEELLSEAAILYPDDPWTLSSYGIALLNLDRYEEAQQVLLRASEKMKYLTADDWARAYPGNHPDMADPGLQKMREIINYNLGLANAAVDNKLNR
ncbi:MAG: tetratricopeptide repeat protein [Candidatus Paceibacterota bacterium]